ncbi:hypothetical protein CWI38_2624p0010, partial [Hamiltosporidium tvaerminnensis]
KDFVEIEKSENFMEYPAIFTDKNGTFSVFNLGKFPKNNNKQFYSSKYIYPIGYKSFRIFESFLSKNFRSQIYECTILSINNCLDMEIKVDDQYKFSGSSIWSNFCQKFEYPLPFCNVEEFFGLECKELMKKIESLGDITVFEGYQPIEMRKIYIYFLIFYLRLWECLNVLFIYNMY